MFENVHNVQKCSLCSKMFTLFENVQKRRKVIKCGLGVTYPLTSPFDNRNIELRCIILPKVKKLVTIGTNSMLKVMMAQDLSAQRMFEK